MTNVKESLMDSKQMTSDLFKLEKSLTSVWRMTKFIQKEYDVNQLNQLTPIQKDYFANNIANVASELQYLAESIDEEIASVYS